MKMRRIFKNTTELQNIARDIRSDIVEMVWQAGSGHIGGSLSCVEILVALYFHVMDINPSNPYWEDRDRFILSKGHSAAALYATLAGCGYFERELLFNSFIRVGGILPEHPDMRKTPGIDMSTGSLGQGLSVAAGMAWGARYMKKKFRIFSLMGCGEMQEGQIWESAMAASQLGLDNLIGIIDYNKLQVNGHIDKVMGVEPLRDKWFSFGWEVKEVDGHSIFQIIDTLESVNNYKVKPKVIIAHTVKGKGVSFIEGKYEFHATTLDKKDYELAMQELKIVK